MEKALNYNKVWAFLITAVLLVILRYVDIDLNDLIEAAGLLFAVYAVPNGRLPLQKPEQ